MIVVGLTGSIGMGKTATAKLFAEEGVPVYDADAAVHALYAKGGKGVGPIGNAFPSAVKEGAVDRDALSQAVLDDAAAFKKLEGIIHPLVGEAQRDWIEARRAEGAGLVVLDIPLLFETGGNERVDKVVVVSAPEELQRGRVLEREGMSHDKLDAILQKQVPDETKRAKADFIVETSGGVENAREQVQAVLRILKYKRQG